MTSVALSCLVSNYVVCCHHVSSCSILNAEIARLLLSRLSSLGLGLWCTWEDFPLTHQVQGFRPLPELSQRAGAAHFRYRHQHRPIQRPSSPTCAAWLSSCGIACRLSAFEFACPDCHSSRPNPTISSARYSGMSIRGPSLVSIAATKPNDSYHALRSKPGACPSLMSQISM